MNLDFLESFNLKNFDLIKASERLPGPLRLRALATALDFAVPFNFGLGIEIETLTPNEVVLISPDKRKRRNHVGSAHACFLALLSEYPAGLVIAQNYSFQKYRIIISKLEIEYFKQGRGELRGISRKPDVVPVFANGEAFLEMQTEIVNKQGERVSLCKTLWQIKEWSQVRSPKK